MVAVVVLGEESESQLSPEPPGSDEVRLSQPATGGARAGLGCVTETRPGGIRDMVRGGLVTSMVTIMVTIMVTNAIMDHQADLTRCCECATQVH